MAKASAYASLGRKLGGYKAGQYSVAALNTAMREREKQYDIDVQKIDKESSNIQGVLGFIASTLNTFESAKQGKLIEEQTAWMKTKMGFSPDTDIELPEGGEGFLSKVGDKDEGLLESVGDKAEKVVGGVGGGISKLSGIDFGDVGGGIKGAIGDFLDKFKKTEGAAPGLDVDRDVDRPDINLQGSKFQMWGSEGPKSDEDKMDFQKTMQTYGKDVGDIDVDWKIYGSKAWGEKSKQSYKDLYEEWRNQ